MRDANEAKFTEDDLSLFKAIVTDLFPNVEISNDNQSALESAIKRATKASNLTSGKDFKHKILQLYITLKVRFGVLIVGDANTGKSTCYEILAKALTDIRKNGLSTK